MAVIDSKVVFVTTSPRTPSKMIPEIALLKEHFEGKQWNHDSQVAFMELLRDENYFNGSGAKDPAFSARDRINRAPKSLGFVSLSPTIALTPAGERLITAKRTEEIFLRQLLKFQLPLLSIFQDRMPQIFVSNRILSFFVLSVILVR